MRRAWLVLALTAAIAAAQTTQGLITGRIVAAYSGEPIAKAKISAVNSAINLSVEAASGETGIYVLPDLPPGTYRIRLSAEGYQAAEVYEMELRVAARLDLSVRLRPLGDVWEAGQYRSMFLPNSDEVVTFFGPDVDASRSGSFDPTRGVRGALESTVSQVIDPVEVRDLPFSGRDVYTMLVTLPGVTADAATVRGLGLSTNGQRPSASNFLLDGDENNDYLVTGPLTALAPEAVQEYRVSISSYSAEYGRTAGFVANAVTRSGGSTWHGIGYWNSKNEALNANDFQSNLRGSPRRPLKETQIGFQAGGPVLSNTLFASTALDYLRSRSRADPEVFQLPTTVFATYTAPGSISRGLLERYPPPPVTDGMMPVANLSIAPPVSVDRLLVLERLDWSPQRGRGRLTGRLAMARLDRPDFIWTPYSDFVSGLHNDNFSLAAGYVLPLTSSLTSELRFGWSHGTLQWDRAHPEIPTLASLDGTYLPGSPAFYAFRNRGRALELAGNVILATGRHIVKAGGGFLLRRLDGHLTAGADARYVFWDFLDFSIDRPMFFSASVDRQSLPSLILPRFQREYSYQQFQAFVQDTFRVKPRLTLNIGLRLENLGVPSNAGSVKDGVVSFDEARVVFPAGGNQQLYNSAGIAWAPRFGFSYDPTGSGRMLLRGAYGLFFDRPFDNVWLNVRNNNFVLPTFIAQPGDYLRPVGEVLPQYQDQRFSGDFPALTHIAPDLSAGYVQSYFLGVERRISRGWEAEADFLGALGRRLITTDQVNRRVPGRITELPLVSYRASQGLSSYYGLGVVARYRTRAAQFQASYTWSHAIDLQSEPLASDFFDLSFTRVGATAFGRPVAAFAQQSNSRGDRGNSDFDQRHNLVFFSIWDIPTPRLTSKAGVLLSGWRFSQLAAFRTGFPFTVFAPSTTEIFNNRADIIGPAELKTPVTGGRRILSGDAFEAPPPGRIGNSGRNAFRGPGLFNIDISLGRTIPLGFFGEAGRLTLRADFYNILNHVNLGNPDSFLGSASFGIARYGRQGFDPGFPALSPLVETARQIQLLLRLEF